MNQYNGHTESIAVDTFDLDGNVPSTGELLDEIKPAQLALQTVGESLLRNLDDRTQAPNELFHYTTGDGLLGIASTGALWATSAWFMNDASELTYARAVLENELESLLKESQLSEDHPWKRCLARLRDDCNKWLSIFDAYVVCFSELEDSLSQWRAYGGDTGYSLGFESSSLRLEVPQGAIRYLFKRVTYDPEEQSRQISSLLGVIEAVVTDHEGDPQVADDAALVAGLNVLVPSLCSFKHPSFEEEREWRYVVLGSPLFESSDVKFRNRRGTPLPYFELRQRDAPHLPIRSLRHGPHPVPEVVERYLRMLLLSNKLESVAITGSKVPLRML